MRFLDDVIDVSGYPFPELAKATRATRNVGLGVMGLAEMLASLGIPYDSDEGDASTMKPASSPRRFRVQESKVGGAGLLVRRGSLREHVKGFGVIARQGFVI